MNGGSVSQGWPGMTHGSVSDSSLSQRLALLQRGTNPSQIETLQFTSRGLHHHPADTGAKVWRTFIFGSLNRKRERLRSFSKLSIFGLCINWFNTVIQQLSEIRKSSLSHLPPVPLVSVRLHVCYLLIYSLVISWGWIIFCSSCLLCQVFLRPSSFNNNSLTRIITAKYTSMVFNSLWWYEIYFIPCPFKIFLYYRNSRIKYHELIWIGKIADEILRHAFTFSNMMIEDIRVLNMAVAISQCGCNKFTNSSWFFWSISGLAFLIQQRVSSCYSGSVLF